MSQTATFHPVSEVPVLALRGLTIFPHMPMNFDVGRPRSIQAAEAAMEGGKRIFLVAQRELTAENPKREDLWDIGVLCTVRQILRLPGDNIRVMVEGTARGRLFNLTQTDPFLKGAVEELTASAPRRPAAQTEALIRTAYEALERYAQINPKLTPDILLHVLTSEDPGFIADFVAQNITMRNEDKQKILEELRPIPRLKRLIQLLEREIDVMTLEQAIAEKVRDRVNENQKDYYLREQLKVLRNELGEDEEKEGDEYREKIDASRMPEEIKEKLRKEVRHMEKQSFGSAEASVSRNYLDVCLELPWGVYTKERADVAAARKILDAEHFGLEKVKERILEFLAVKQLAPDLNGQIICLVGPPGVGKTSIAASLAKATNRKMARISLGGIRDEAEIRGHRKTYIGAMPGRIINAVRQAGSQNPLLLLDEIDKLGTDGRSDPSAALLEVLDSEQNSTFRDHFLEVPFDLSRTLFLLTANSLSGIPRPLLDRMEVIELPSYTDEEKLQIAKKYLAPKQRKRYGLNGRQLKFSDEALKTVIEEYTKESGVRGLERRLAELCRKSAKLVVDGTEKQISLTENRVHELLGAPPYHKESLEKEDQVGLVNGLAWTSVGGELLQAEANAVPGSGKVELTGNLGKVMKESASAALTYIRSRSKELGLEEDFYKKYDLHVHFPEGAVPKDGPSAGVTITTAMVSALSGVPVRQDIAMTGEVTLRGRVLPIGGLREKTMAALRNGIRTVILPAENAPDLEKIDPLVREQLTFYPVSHVNEVLKLALRPQEKAEPAAEKQEAQPDAVLLPPESSPESGRRVQMQ